MGALSPDVFAVLRYTVNGLDTFGEVAQDSAVLLLINRSEQVQSVRFSAEDICESEDAAVSVSINGLWRDAMTEEEFIAAEEGMQIELRPMSALLLMKLN